MILSISRLHGVKWQDDIRTVKNKGFGRKWFWLDKGMAFTWRN
jgi:hypothetical protein